MMVQNGTSLIIMEYKQRQFLLQDFRLLLHLQQLKLVWEYLQVLEMKERGMHLEMRYV